MTNGEKILTTFPNLYVCVLYLDFHYMHIRDRNVKYPFEDTKTCFKFPIEWWNAPYKADKEVESED